MPDQYDAFNYEISGNGAGTVTVTWSDKLLLSQWAMKYEPVYDNKTSTYSYDFTVDDLTTVKQFQFYRNPEKLELLDGKKWSDIENLVTISFSE